MRRNRNSDAITSILFSIGLAVMVPVARFFEMSWIDKVWSKRLPPADTMDGQFARAIGSLGAIRYADRRSITINAPQAFDDLLDAYSQDEFEQWMEGHYELIKDRSARGENFKMFYLPWKDIKKFDRRFSWWDRVTIYFQYTDDWERITGFKAWITWTLG